MKLVDLKAQDFIYLQDYDAHQFFIHKSPYEKPNVYSANIRNEQKVTEYLYNVISRRTNLPISRQIEMFNIRWEHK